MSNPNKSLSRLSQNALLGLLLMIIGIVFCVERDSILNTLFIIVGTILLVLGTFELFNKNWLIGAIELAAGIVIIVFACISNLVAVALLILGIALSAYAIYLLVMAIIKFKDSGAARIFVALVAPLLMLTIGILLIVAYAVEGIPDLFIAVGAIAIAAGVFIIVFELIKDLKRNTASSSSSSKSTTTKKTATKSKKSSK